MCVCVSQAEEIPELKQGKLLSLVNRLLTEERDRLLKVSVTHTHTHTHSNTHTHTHTHNHSAVHTGCRERASLYLEAHAVLRMYIPVSHMARECAAFVAVVC